MRTFMLMLAVASFAVPASADPFSGRYNVESIPNADGAFVSGWIDFTNAPMGTDTFSLGDAFVSGFELRGSGPTIGADIVYDSFSQSTRDDDIKFDNALGAAVLEVLPVVNAAADYWIGEGDLDGENDGNDRLALGVIEAVNATTRWVVDDSGTVYSLNARASAGRPYVWRLVLAEPVPEPGTIVLFGMGALGFAAYRLKRRRAS